VNSAADVDAMLHVDAHSRFLSIHIAGGTKQPVVQSTTNYALNA